MTKAKAKQLKRLCPASYRVVTFNKTIKAASVANKDLARSQVGKLVNGEKTMWPPGACNMGMVMWVQLRTWFPIEDKPGVTT